MRIYKNKLLHMVLYFVVSTVITYFWISVPLLKMDVTSNVDSVSQLFYQSTINGGYSEKNSERINISEGFNRLIFKLPYYNDNLRLDIATVEYEVTIHKIYVSFPFVEIPVKILDYSYQIKNIINTNDEIKIFTMDDSTDPQIFLKVNKIPIENIRILFSIFYGLIITIALIFFKQLEAMIIKIINISNDRISIILSNIINRKLRLSDFGIFFIIAVIFHFFEISNFLLSIDDEFSAFRIAPELWVGQGRWTVFLVEKFIFNQPTMPVVPNIVACSLMALSYMFLIHIHKIENNWKVYFLFPIYVAFPTLWMINEFYGNLVTVSLGFLLVLISLYIFVELVENLNKENNKLLVNLVLPSIILSIAIGAYQSFIMLALTIGIGILILNMNNEKENKIKYIIFLVIYLVYSLIFYLVVNKIFKILFPSDSTYIDNFINIYGIDFILLSKNIFKQMIEFYSGSPNVFGVSMNALIILFVFVFLITTYKKSKLILRILLFVLLLTSPFIFHILSGGVMPTRMMLSIPYIIWLMAFISINNKKLLTNIIGIIIILFILIQMLSAIGQYSATTFVGQVQDRMLAGDLYKRIAESNPAFDRTKISYIDIYGYKNIDSIYPHAPTSTMNTSFFGWDVHRMNAYMKLLGYSNLVVVDQNRALENTAKFETMPSWPNKNSVQYIDGIYLIKLGEYPDFRRK